MPRPSTPAPPATDRSHSRSRVIRWTVVALWAAVIFGASSIQGSQVPGRFGTLAHFVEYAVLGGLTYAALRLDQTEARSARLAVGIAALYAVTDELHQAFVPGRVPDPLDWAVDTSGAALAVLGIVLAGRVLRKRRQ